MRPFLPIRFLNLLPLSHMFGQAMATFVPPMLPGRRASSPAATRPKTSSGRFAARRISVLVCVPKILEVLRDHVIRVCTRRRRPTRRAEMHWVAALVAVPARASGVRSEVLGVRRRRGAARSRARDVLGTSRVRRRPGLRADRNGADRDAEPSAARSQGRGRQTDRRRRDEDRRRRRDPGARRQRHARLLQRAGRDAAPRSRTAGSTPATSARSTTRASCTSAAARRR